MFEPLTPLQLDLYDRIVFSSDSAKQIAHTMQMDQGHLTTALDALYAKLGGTRIILMHREIARLQELLRRRIIFHSAVDFCRIQVYSLTSDTRIPIRDKTRTDAAANH